MQPNYPKRLIEVDLPIKRISAHALREKARHADISSLHIWWARRPLAACRAVICAALWFDPVDENCPLSFRDAAREQMRKWSKDSRALLSAESFDRFEAVRRKPELVHDNELLRSLLLDFIADFSNLNNSARIEYLETSRALTQAAHNSLPGQPRGRSLIVDPFAGGGSIPLEALRIGADVFASDLNPVAVLLNKVALEYVPQFGERLVNEVRKRGKWITGEVETRLQKFYPRDPDGAMPVTYLWARTISCEGPGCGIEIPLIRSTWLAKKDKRSIALRLVANKIKKKIEIEIIENARSKDLSAGTSKRGSATCPSCGFTTSVSAVRKQLIQRHGGTNDARLLAVVTIRPGERGRFYRLPNAGDYVAVAAAKELIENQKQKHRGGLSLVPQESTEDYETFVNRGPIYGMTKWEDYFSPRQQLALSTFASVVRDLGSQLADELPNDLARATQTCLALVVDKAVQYNSSLCRWKASGESLVDTFGRQALPMVWDFAEAVPFAGSSGDFDAQVDQHATALSTLSRASAKHPGRAQMASATAHPLPDDSVDAFITDPPYYYSIQYADLSDFFYVWLRRTLLDQHPDLLSGEVTPKVDEIIVQTPGHQFAPTGKNKLFYESRMQVAMKEGRRILSPSGVGIVVFAHTSTAGWEAQIKAIIDAGWTITGSWPIDTEMATRVIAQGRSVLASSIHLVCRPRGNPDGLAMEEIGDWRDVLEQLPRRIHEWMPRLEEEGVVGADAIFACLGPALEIFSRYSRVEKASGEEVELKRYLEEVWSAVANEALTMVFKDADATGFEEDARLTAMWLWTLFAGVANGDRTASKEKELRADEDDADQNSAKGGKESGFVLEYDAARKIAQGLGAHLEDLPSVLEINGDEARLLSVAQRTEYLFGRDDSEDPPKRRKKDPQRNLFEVVAEVESDAGGWGSRSAPKLGNTILDRVHQSMILFAAGRGEALKRFLVDDGAGRDERFWRLAQALVALYPKNTDERRWIEGVMGRKKGLGF